MNTVDFLNTEQLAICDWWDIKTVEKMEKYLGTKNDFRKMVNIVEGMGSELYNKMLQWASSPFIEYRDRTHVALITSPGSTWNASDPVSFYAGCQMEEFISKVVGCPLRLSYTGVKTSISGIPLKPHRDLNCDSEYLLSWTAVSKGSDEFLIHIRKPGNEIDTFNTADSRTALIFAGEYWEHWRPPTKASRTVMIYFRYTATREGRMTAYRDELCRIGLAELEGNLLELSEDANKALNRWSLAGPEKYQFTIVDVHITDKECQILIDLVNNHGETIDGIDTTETKMIYNPIEGRIILERVLPIAIRETGIKLHCESTFLRKGDLGATLAKHTDRENLDITITFPLTEQSANWPFGIDGAPPVRVPLGKGILIDGQKVPHWRDSCEFAPSYWLLLHYRKG